MHQIEVDQMTCAASMLLNKPSLPVIFLTLKSRSKKGDGYWPLNFFSNILKMQQLYQFEVDWIICAVGMLLTTLSDLFDLEK